MIKPYTPQQGNSKNSEKSGKEALNHILEECRRNFGTMPRSFSAQDKQTYLRVPDGGPNSRFAPFFKAQDNLLSDGQVVWAHLIQANGLLFQQGDQDLPAVVVYCSKATQKVTPIDLAPIAKSLFELKGTVPKDPDLKVFADNLTGEHTRQFGLAVPKKLAPDFPCAVSPVIFCRKHLPNKKLSSPFFPLIIRSDGIVMPLPSRFWPQQLINFWNRKR